MRAAAAEGNFRDFKLGVPSTSNDTLSRKLFDAVRKGMGVRGGDIVEECLHIFVFSFRVERILSLILRMTGEYEVVGSPLLCFSDNLRNQKFMSRSGRIETPKCKNCFFVWARKVLFFLFYQFQMTL